MITRAQLAAAEKAALDRLERACQRRQNAFISLNGQWLPHGCEVPPPTALYETDVAEAEVREAQAEVSRIAEEIRAGRHV